MKTFYKTIVLFLCYVALGVASASYEPHAGILAPIWLPTGLTVAILWTQGKKLWPVIFVGAFVVDRILEASFGEATFTAASAIAEGLGAVYLLDLLAVEKRLNSLSDVNRFLLVSAGASILGAALGVIGLSFRNDIPPGGLGFYALNWLGADMTGCTVGTPFFLFLIDWKNTFKKEYRKGEALICAVVISILTYILFSSSQENLDFQITYLLFPLLFWASLRFEQFGASVATLLVSVISIWKTIHGFGPFAISKFSIGLLHLQLFMLVYSGTALVSSALSAEIKIALQLRDEFLSLASHELKSPLTSIQLQIYFVKRLFGLAPKTQTDFTKIDTTLKNTSDQVGRVSNLVDDLLDISNIESGELALNYQNVNLLSLTQGVIDRYSSQLEMARCEVEVSIPECINGLWDPLRVEQIIINLLTNAIKYAPGGPLKISAELIGNFVTLTFQDFGPGIEKKYQARVFNRFERFGQPERVSGLGLGLFITKQIIDALKGSIAITSDLGKGTRFTINLPLKV